MTRHAFLPARAMMFGYRSRPRGLLLLTCSHHLDALHTCGAELATIDARGAWQVVAAYHLSAQRRHYKKTVSKGLDPFKINGLLTNARTRPMTSSKYGRSTASAGSGQSAEAWRGGGRHGWGNDRHDHGRYPQDPIGILCRGNPIGSHRQE